MSVPAWPSSAPGGPAAVAIDRLAVRYGGRPALDDVSVWARGGVVAVLGPNGAGKTTLLRCLATVVRPDRGAAFVDGLDPRVAEQRRAIRARLGYVPQSPTLPGTARAFDAVDVVATCKELGPERWRRGQVLRALDAVGLAHRAGDRIRALSGGMRQRVALAQALVGRPTLLVLDEPAADLDPEQRVRLRHLLAERGDEATVVVSTHLLGEAAEVGDALVVLDEGRVAFAGRPADLAATAGGRVWWAEAAPPASPAVRLAWRTADGRWRCLGTPPPGAPVAEPTLEDAYLLLVGPAGRG